MNWEGKKRRKEEIIRRAKTPNEAYRHCRVIGCKRPALAGTTKGVNQRFCRVHEDQYERHGSPYRKSYAAAELDPYRRAALDWLTANGGNPYVRNAIGKLESLYAAAGHHIEATSLRGLTPRERANAAWARLRKAEIDPRLPLAAWLAVEMITKADSQAETKPEFKLVQAAKVVHRLASGTHKRWDRDLVDGRKEVIELHRFPASRGRVLRHIGKDIERAAELIAVHHLSNLLKLKSDRETQHQFGKRARPSRLPGVRKRQRLTQDSGNNQMFKKRGVW